MFRSPMRVGIAVKDQIPPGWHYWESLAASARPDRVRRYAKPPAIQATPWPKADEDCVIVRAVPGTPDHGLVGVCEGDWPVTEEEREEVRARWAKIDYLAGADDAEIDRSIRAADPHRGYALTAPVHLTAAKATAYGAEALYSAHHMGRIRWCPEQDGWLAETGWCGSIRTLPGGHSDAETAARRLLDALRESYLGECRRIQAEQRDVGWGAISVPRHLQLRAVLLRHRLFCGAWEAAGEDVLAEISTPPIRWAERVYIQPVGDCVDGWAGTDHAVCPDCGGHIRWAEAGHVPGWRRCYGRPIGERDGQPIYDPAGGCGSEWRVAEHDGWWVLERQDDLCGQFLGHVDTTALAQVEIPDREQRIEAARQRQAQLRAQRRREIEQAMSILRRNPRVAPHLRQDGLQPGAQLRLRNGLGVSTLGPVRLRDDGREALALVEILAGVGRPRRIWLALGYFA